MTHRELRYHASNPVDLLRRTRRRYPDKLAIRCGAVDWTYAQFDTVCDKLAAGLARIGIDIGDRIAVISRSSHAFAALRSAMARLGAVLVPINFKLNAEELRRLAASCSMPALACYAWTPASRNSGVMPVPERRWLKWCGCPGRIPPIRRRA